MARATDRDKAHFVRVAEASAALERARERAAALESPAAKIEQALRLSNALLRAAPRASIARNERTPVSLAARWRKLRAGRL
jgi:hypothetical protein